MEKCPTCNKPATDPYRVYDASNSKVIAGCVDVFHYGHLATCTETAYWHYRKEAVRIRTAMRKCLQGK